MAGNGLPAKGYLKSVSINTVQLKSVITYSSECVVLPAAAAVLGAERIDGYVRNFTFTQPLKQTLLNPDVRLRCRLDLRLCAQHPIIASTAAAQQARPSETL